MEPALNYKKGLKDGLPIALGYLSVSFAFGALAVSKGLYAWVALLISATNLTSAGQLAGVGCIVAGNTVFTMILTQLVINARYFLMSLTLTQKLDKKFTLLDRFLCAVGITDEIFAVAVTQKQPVTKRYLLGLITLPYVGWTSGTIMGALLGGILPAFISDALSIALYAMFIAIFIPTAIQNKKVFPVLFISVGISCLFTFTPYLNQVPSGIAYVVAALVASVFGALVFPIKDEDTVQGVEEGEEALQTETAESEEQGLEEVKTAEDEDKEANA